jgi:hypothetical protein
MCGYSEMCFNIAEAAQRGWVNADVEKFYLEGVTASLRFYGINQGTKLPRLNLESRLIKLIGTSFRAY